MAPSALFVVVKATRQFHLSCALHTRTLSFCCRMWVQKLVVCLGFFTCEDCMGWTLRLTWIGIVSCIVLSVLIVSSRKGMYLENYQVLYTCYWSDYHFRVFCNSYEYYLDPYDLVWILIIEKLLLKVDISHIVYSLANFIWDLSMTIYLDLFNIYPKQTFYVDFVVLRKYNFVHWCINHSVHSYTIYNV